VKQAQISGTEDKDITMKFPSGNERKFTGQVFLLNFSLPNFYFHYRLRHFAQLRRRACQTGLYWHPGHSSVTGHAGLIVEPHQDEQPNGQWPDARLHPNDSLPCPEQSYVSTVFGMKRSVAIAVALALAER
jgi:hypothetical protein